MNPFQYVRATDMQSAIDAATGPAVPARFLAGGTNLIDLMREGVEQPRVVVDITRLSLTAIEERADGGVRVCAMVRNSHLASHAVIREQFPLLSYAILNGASAQLRNMATTGGNLMQRTRCYYFYDTASHCNKREPGSGCDAIGGFNRIHAILGASSQCIATHPSDMCVALAALDATVNIEGPQGARVVAFADFHRLPGETPQVDNALLSGELITSVDLPGSSAGLRSAYRKIRDRASYAFALVSVAAALRIADGRISDVRLALGGVAHKPWRAVAAERTLIGTVPTRDGFIGAAEAELKAAVPQAHNAFKIALAKRTIVAALTELADIGGEAR